MLRCYYAKVSFANAEPTASTKSRSRISCWPQYNPIIPWMFSLSWFSILSRCKGQWAVMQSSWQVEFPEFPLNLRLSKPVSNLPPGFCEPRGVVKSFLSSQQEKIVKHLKSWERLFWLPKTERCFTMMNLQDGDLTTFPRKTRPSVSCFSVLSCWGQIWSFAALSAQVHARAWRFDRLGFAHKSAGKIWYGKTSGLKILCIQGRCFERVEWYLVQFFLIDVSFMLTASMDICSWFCWFAENVFASPSYCGSSWSEVGGASSGREKSMKLTAIKWPKSRLRN